MNERMFYRKEKLRGACWEYQIEGGWIDQTANVLIRHYGNALKHVDILEQRGRPVNRSRWWARRGLARVP